MSKLKTYLLATAGLVILGGVVQFVRPLQADPLEKDVNVANTPLPVVVENGILDIVEIIEDNVPNNTDVNVFTVPAESGLVITDVLISWADGGLSCRDIRILRGGLPATSIISVPAHSTFSHAFATGIHFVAGETVTVSNGNTGCIVHFYLRGYLTML